MEFYELATCEECGKSYKGKFRMDLNGKVTCINCEEIEKMRDELEWETFESEEGLTERLILDTVKEMLIADVEKIYSTESVKGENFVLQFLGEDGKIKKEKLYFYHNPIDLVIEGQKIALSSMRYLDGAKNPKRMEKNDERRERHIEHAEKLVDKYKSFRLKKFSEEEIIETWDLYKTNPLTKNILRSDNLYE